MKTKTILLTAASVLASASLAWAQTDAPAPGTPAAPAAESPALTPASAPPAAPVPAAAPTPPPPAAPSAGMGGGGMMQPSIGGGTGGGGGMTTGSSGGGGGVIQLTRDGVVFTRPTSGPPITVEVNSSSTQDIMDDAQEPQEPELTTGVMAEESNLNLDAAIKRYQQTIAKFDSRRSATAQAVFRLGECYRKMGRMEEAKVQYARILREFPDQEALVKSSQTYLFGNGSRGQSGYSTRLQSIVTRRPASITKKGSTVTITDQSVSNAHLAPGFGSAESADALEGNFDQDIALLNKQIAEAQQQVKLGVAPTATVDKLQRELLELQREKMTKTMEVNRQNLQRLAQTLKQSSEQPTFVTVDPATGLPVTTGIALADRELELMRRELALTQESVFLRKREAEEARTKEEAVKQHVDKPWLLGSVLAADAVYIQLKREYETAVLSASSGNSADDQKQVNAATNHLMVYIEKICLPQLEEATQYAMRRWEVAKMRIDEIKKQIDQKEKAQAQLQRAGSAAPKVEHAPDAFGPAPKPAEAYPAPEAK